MYATKVQAKELRAAVVAVKADPRSFNMDIWTNACGTVCCLAGQIVRNSTTRQGWRCIAAAQPDQSDLIPELACGILGVSRGATSALFYTGNWPAEFCVDDTGRSTVNPTPQQLEARVEHWIRTGE